ncbi:hypothetical protein [Desulfocurvibacter africanus]|uniref:Uncharacterized protein n=1 Tax=Desulfocurvibacter africanus subsp. africanus str. Walvis Bay TaxID=690850 RepID=F3YZA5_DESAF|nr:hypothetical protein [Desulfocurvibacter africanus]EGJ50861.1 hypothetical protein Desaf_2539 [Desulfocurvibacter africanus subsp. africanus str. Walvis Bay]
MSENSKTPIGAASQLHFTDGLVIRIRELSNLFRTELGLDTVKAMKLAVMVASPAAAQQIVAIPALADPFRP